LALKLKICLFILMHLIKFLQKNKTINLWHQRKKFKELENLYKIKESENHFEDQMKIGIAIPTYNEKANLQTLIDRILKVFENNRRTFQ